MGNSRVSFGLAVLLVTSAFAGDVKVSHDTSVDFSKYHTYTVKPHLPATNAEYQARIETDIDASLQAAGWKKVESGAEIEVVTVAYTEDEVDASVRNLWGTAEGWAPAMTDVRDIAERILTIDLVDTETGARIWHAAAHKTINENQDMQQDIQKGFRLIDESVKRMFKEFPPK